jgi:hypothetical protein
MILACRRCGRAPEEVGRDSAPQPVALVRSLLVVERHERLERALHRGPGGEVLPPELDPPVLVQNRALQPLDEAVGPGMPRFRPGVANAVPLARLVEGAFELRAAIGEDPLERPARAPIDGQQKVGQEGGRRLGRQARHQPGHPIRRGRIAGGDLPHLANALELANVERVEADQLARLRRVDVPAVAVKNSTFESLM